MPMPNPAQYYNTVMLCGECARRTQDFPYIQAKFLSKAIGTG